MYSTFKLERPGKGTRRLVLSLLYKGAHIVVKDGFVRRGGKDGKTRGCPRLQK